MAQNKKDRLDDALAGDYPDAFIFDAPGAKLLGKVAGFSKGFSKYGPHPVVTVQNEENGEIVSVHCLHTSLRNQMAEADPKVGDRIGVLYVGDAVAEKGKNAGKTYKEFRVRIDSPSRSFGEAVGRYVSRDEDDDMPF